VSVAVAARTRWISALLVVASLGVLSHFVQVWTAIPPAAARTSDFAGTYAAAIELRTGHNADMYNEAAEQQVLAASGAPANHLNIPFENPPAAAVIASPVALLDPGNAYRVWSLLQLMLLVAAVAVAVRAAPWPRSTALLVKLAVAGIAIASFATGLLFIEAQWDGVLVLGVALAYACWRGEHAATAGFAIGFTAAIAKPHLAIGIAAFMLGRRDWRALAGAASGAAATVLIGLVAAGPVALEAFVAALLKPSNSPLAQMQGMSGLFSSLLGVNGFSYLLGLGATVVAALVAAWLGAVSVRDRRLFEPALAGAVVLSLLAAPHLLGHDLTLLAPPLVFGLAWLAARKPAHAFPAGWPDRDALLLTMAWIALSFATMYDLGKNTTGLPGRLTPWVLLLLAAACTATVLGGFRPGWLSHGARIARPVESV
jgi:glycosyl transferase family 87